MNITYKTTKEDVNWQQVSDVLWRSNLSKRPAEEQKKIFMNSYAVVFVYDDDKIVGVARALSDGVCQAAVYNVALDDEYQGCGIGRELIERLLKQLEGQNIMLYTHPRTIALYEKFGFRRNKTALTIYGYCCPPESREFVENNGFLLPDGYRFESEYGQGG